MEHLHGVCVGIILLIIAIAVIASAIIDFDPSTTIENNTTIELNGIQITVPQTNNYTINDSAALWNVNDTDKYGTYHVDEIRQGNAWSYYDENHNITICCI